MKTINVSEATGAALDWLVAKAEGPVTNAYGDVLAQQPHYSRDWNQGGPILDRHIDCMRKRSKAEEAELAHPNPNFKFKAEIFADIAGYFCGFGPTPLIAAMRCYVISKLGETVEVPKELT